jgi:hypothetical protein
MRIKICTVAVVLALAVPVAALEPIRESLARGAVLDSVVAKAEVEAEGAALRRRVFIIELENEATRAIADGTAADILAGGADLAVTGWGISTGTQEESNTMLGESRDTSLALVGVKAVSIVATYSARRKMYGEWKACRVRNYDAGTSEPCSQADSAKRMTRLATLARVGLIIGNLFAVLK